MNQATASLLVVVVLIGLAIWLGISPPAGFQELPYRIVLPFVLVAVAFSQLENLRMRTHMAELIGAIRSAVGQSKAAQGRAAPEPTPEMKGEAIRILLGSLQSDDAAVRRTSAIQLSKLTGQDFGEDVDQWKRWWSQNHASFGTPE